jgi:hypothetical protein
MKNSTMYKVLNNKDKYFDYKCSTLEEAKKAIATVCSREWIKNPEIKDPTNYVILEEVDDYYTGVKYGLDKDFNIIRKEVA